MSRLIQSREKSLAMKVPEVFAPLAPASRYKGCFGGRGSGKSWFFGGRLIMDHVVNRGLSSVSLREVQKDLKSSAKKLVEGVLQKHQIGEAQGFKVYNDCIKTPGDGVIIFQGLQDHTAESVKSLEDFGRAWVEEAQTVSANSLNLLRPTIRAPGSELWFSWNPRRKSDPVDVMLRGAEQPTGSILVKANWHNNPFFTAELEQERLDCLRMQPDQYPHIWDGDYITVNSSAYFAKEITLARAENRIGGNVPVDPLMTIRAFWDIGGTGAKADAVAIWVAQFIGKEIRIVDYYETVGQPLAFHLNWLRSNGYDGCLCVLPHDGAQHDKIESITYEGAIKKAGFPTKVIKNQGTGAAMQRIEAVRRLFPAMWFDNKCEAGIDAASWFHERKDDKRNIGLGPEHDWSSHGCFIGNTLISTNKGDVEIKDICIGDMVLTPEGYARVDNAGVTKISTELIEITLSDGKMITCTPEHMIFTFRGLVQTASLCYNDRIITIENLSCVQLVNAKEMGYRDAFIENMQESNIGINQAQVNIDRVLSTINNGFIALLLKPMIILKFGPKMVIGTILKKLIGIQKSVIKGLTKVNIQLKNSMVSNTIDKLTQDTIQESCVKTDDNEKNIYIDSYGNMLMGVFQTDTMSIIRMRIKAITELKTSYYLHVVRIVRYILLNITRRNKKQMSSVLCAEKHTGHTSLQKQNIAVEVVSIKVIKKELPVYDLTVNHHHCYFANGILVSNCDALGLLAIAYEELVKEKTKRNVVLPRYTSLTPGMGY